MRAAHLGENSGSGKPKQASADANMAVGKYLDTTDSGKNDNFCMGEHQIVSFVLRFATKFFF